MISEVRAIDSLDEMTLIIKNELCNITEGFVAVGFYLKKTMKDELYKQSGYETIYDYAKETFGIGRSTASRFMEINTQYSENGFSPQIDDKWRGYGSSKLTEMLGLPEEIQNVIPTTATVRDIREAKTIMKETESHFSDQLELTDFTEEITENDWMKELVKIVFKEPKEVFEQMVDWIRKPDAKDGDEIEWDILAIVNSTKFKSVRLAKANVMMLEKVIKVMPYRGQGENENFKYIDLAKAFEEVFFPGGDVTTSMKLAYERVYGEKLYPQEKPEPEKPESKKEEKTVKNEKKPQKSDSKSQKPELKKEAVAVGEEKKDNNLQPDTPVSAKNAPSENPPVIVNTITDEVSGQAERTRDFPEDCPEEIIPDKITPAEESDICESRKLFLQKLDTYDAAEYIAIELEEFMNKWGEPICIKTLLNSDFWMKFLEQEVDEEGRELK